MSVFLALSMVGVPTISHAEASTDTYVPQNLYEKGIGNSDRMFCTSGGSSLQTVNKAEASDGQIGTKHYTIAWGNFIDWDKTNGIPWEKNWADIELKDWNYAAKYRNNSLTVNGISYELAIPFSKESSFNEAYTNTEFRNYFNTNSGYVGGGDNPYYRSIDVDDGYYKGISFLGSSNTDQYIRYVYADGTKSNWVLLDNTKRFTDDTDNNALALDARSWIRVTGNVDVDINSSDGKLYLHSMSNAEADKTKKVTDVELLAKNAVLPYIEGTKNYDITAEPIEGENKYNWIANLFAMTLITDDSCINNGYLAELKTVWADKPSEFTGSKEQMEWVKRLSDARGNVNADLIDIDTDSDSFYLCMEIDEYIISVEDYSIPIYAYLEPTDFANRTNWFNEVGDVGTLNATETHNGFEPNSFKGLKIWDNPWTEGTTENILTFNGYKHKVNVDTTAGNEVAFHSYNSAYKRQPTTILPKGDKSAKSDLYYRFDVPKGYYEGVSFLGGIDYNSQMLSAARLNYSDGTSTGFIDLGLSRLNDKGNKNDYIEADMTIMADGKVAASDKKIYLHQAVIETDSSKVLVSIDLPVQNVYITDGEITGDNNTSSATKYDYNILGIGLKTNKFLADSYISENKTVSVPVSINDIANGNRIFMANTTSGLAKMSDGTFRGIWGNDFINTLSDGAVWKNDWTITGTTSLFDKKVNTLVYNGIDYEIQVPFENNKDTVYSGTGCNSAWMPGGYEGGKDGNPYYKAVKVPEGYYTGISFIGGNQNGNSGTQIRYVYKDGTKSPWVAVGFTNFREVPANSNYIAVNSGKWTNTDNNGSAEDYWVKADEKIYVQQITDESADTNKIITAVEFISRNGEVQSDLSLDPVAGYAWKYQPTIMAMTMLTNKKLQSKPTEPEKDPSTDPIEVYVAPNGDDTAQGTKDAPVATVAGAVKKAQEIDTNSENVREVNIVLADGEYEVTSTVSVRDLRGKVTLKADNGAKPVIKGSKTVSISEMEYANDPRVIASGVRVYDLSDYNLADKICTDTNSIAATNTFGVFVNDVIKPIAEYPNNGELVVDDVYANGNPGKDNAITLTSEKFGKYANVDGWFIEGYIKEKYRTWKSDDFTITGNDLTFNTIKSSNVYSLYRNWRIFNLLEELDTAGEWYVDKDAKKLYYLPVQGEESIEISNMAKTLIEVAVNDFTIDGISFKNTCGNAVTIADGISGTTITNCDFAAIGRNSIEAVNTANTRILNNTLRNIGYMGINVVGGNIETLTPSGNVISQNSVSRTGEVVRSYSYAIKANGVGNEINGNYISDTKSIAVGYGGALNKVVYNVIENAVTEALDAGAVYSGRDLNSLGNEIAYNEITLADRDTGTEVVAGVYMDDGLSGTHAHHNVIKNATRGVFSSGGALNVINNNVFEGCTYGVVASKTDFTDSEFNLVAPTDNAAYIEKFGKDYMDTFNTTPNWSAEKIEIYDNYCVSCENTVNLGGTIKPEPIRFENNTMVNELMNGLSKADIDTNRIGFASDELDTTIAYAEVDGNNVTVNYVSAYKDYKVIAAAYAENGKLIKAEIIENSGEVFTADEAPAYVEIFVWDSLGTIVPMTK